MIPVLTRILPRYSLVKILAGLSSGYALFNHREYLENCGIAGYVGHRPIAVPVIMSGLEDLQNRGYDSAGIATIKDGEVQVIKYASDPFKVSDALRRVREESQNSQTGTSIGIGHTRWATHGRKIDLNAHPHTDHKERIYLVHNGTISNTADIIKFLTSYGIHPKTQTDTELIACLIGLYLDEGHEMEQAVQIVLSRLSGTWGLAILHKDEPNRIIVARRGSPIHIGLGEGQYFIASEPSAFSEYTKKYYSLQQDEIVIVNPDELSLQVSKIKQVPTENLSSGLGDYLHWTQKQIDEQPESVARAMNFGARLSADSAKLGGLEAYKPEFLGIQNLIILGCGTSLHAAMFGASIFRKLGLMNYVSAVDASELTASDIPKERPGVIAISQSGETHDVYQAVKMAKASGIPCVSVVNVVASNIAQLAGHGVYMNSGREVGVASTKSFMNSCVILSEIALWTSKNLYPEQSEVRKEMVNNLAKLPLQIGSVIAATRNQCKKLAKHLKSAEHMFILGRGASEAIAKEGALKIKEIAYIHAQGFAAGALKHGPFALIEEGTPIILLMLNDEFAPLINEAFEQVHGRGAKVVIITTDPELITSHKKPHDIIVIEDAGVMSPLLAVVPLQMLAFYLSIARGHNPDTPRNLAKVVTVRG